MIILIEINLKIPFIYYFKKQYLFFFALMFSIGMAIQLLIMKNTILNSIELSLITAYVGYFITVSENYKKEQKNLINI